MLAATPDSSTKPALVSFSEQIRAQQIGDDRFAIEINDQWQVMRGPLGGYLAGVVLDALVQRLADPARPARTFNARFLGVPVPGPAEIRTRVERVGRSFSWLSAELWQAERLLIVGSAAFSTSWPSIEYAPDSPLFDLPAPNVVEPMPLAVLPPFARNMQHISLHASPINPDSDGRVGGYLKLAVPQAIDAQVLALMSDSWFPSSLGRDPHFPMAATIELNVIFRQPAALAELAPDAHLYTVFWSKLATDGFFEEDGEIWSLDGKLLAQSRQLAIASPVM